MESNRKRKGFVKAKLVMSFYRAVKPPSSTVQYNRPNPSSSIPSADFFANQDHVKVKVSPSSSSTAGSSVGFIVNQDYGTPQPVQKVSFVLPENGRDLYDKFDNPYGVAGDESVDLKAASYISCVQERFRLERINSERRKYQDMH